MSRFKKPPLERHEALAPLSRDHYSGLVLAQHLIKAAAADAVERRKAVAEFVDGWDREIAEHFDDEQRLLQGVMGEVDRKRLVDEHERLRRLAEQARVLRKQTDPDVQVVREIGQTLEAHIRWEERELFTRLQSELNAEQLASLQRQTEAIEAVRPRSVSRDAPARRGTP